MKQVLLFLAVFAFCCGTHYYVFKRGEETGYLKRQSELLQTIEGQYEQIKLANKKILDFQRLIGNNNDECFNRLWPNEVIESVNPSLLR